MPSGAPAKYERVRPAAPSPLHDLVLAADRVGRAVEHVCDRRAARELAVDRDLEGREHVANADLGRDVVRALVGVVVDGGVRVRVDDARSDVLAPAVDLESAGGRRDAPADRRDLPVDDEHVGVLEDAGRALRPDGGAADDDRPRGRERCRPRGPERGARPAPSPPKAPWTRPSRRGVGSSSASGRSVAVDPDLRDRLFSVERLAVADDEVRDPAGLQGAQAVAQARAGAPGPTVTAASASSAERPRPIASRTRPSKSSTFSRPSVVSEKSRVRRRESTADCRARGRTRAGASIGTSSHSSSRSSLSGRGKCDAQDEVGLRRDDLVAEQTVLVARRRRSGPGASARARSARRARSASTSVVSKTTVSRPSAAGTSAAVAAMKRGRVRPAGLRGVGRLRVARTTSRPGTPVASRRPRPCSKTGTRSPRRAPSIRETTWPSEGSRTRTESGPSARLTTAPWPRRTPVGRHGVDDGEALSPVARRRRRPSPSSTSIDARLGAHGRDGMGRRSRRCGATARLRGADRSRRRTAASARRPASRSAET